MDDSTKTPLVFANRAIRLFANNQLGDEVMILPDDYMAMRVVFRKCQGSWEGISSGDVVMTNLLARIVTAWGKNQSKRRKIEVV